MAEETLDDGSATLPISKRKYHRKLTPEEEKFCSQFVISGGRPREAYRLAYAPKPGTKVSTIVRESVALLEDDAIQARIESIRKGTLVTSQFVLQEMSYVAFSDPGELFDEDGKAIPLRFLPRNVRASIAGFEVEQRVRGRGDDAESYNVLKYKLWNKNDALSDIMRHLGMFEKDNLQKSGIEGLLNRLPVAVAEQIIEKISALVARRASGSAVEPPKPALPALPAPPKGVRT